ncbi:McrB family protein [Burkholderia gladioli]|uniref:McrB family protein n=1 Tax=Burkholderia gladioli TaxID=28095 RepID=UPI0016407D7B|nr:AAA family ATPase [Burkholderia gladioli]
MFEKTNEVRKVSSTSMGIAPPFSNSQPALALTEPDHSTPAQTSALQDEPVEDFDYLDDATDGLDDQIETEDPVYQQVNTLLLDGFAGVVLAGPPGTSKSWYARRIAARLVGGDASRAFFIQFHPAYQYEDFVESYVPTTNGGFRPDAKVFLLACQAAIAQPEPVVIVIDELTRTDVARVFGETLTYLERSKRNVPFRLASGRRIAIPPNVSIIATMNPWDRSVEELDLALERRFARITMSPDTGRLKEVLSGSSISSERLRKLELFFNVITHLPNPLCHIGHAYFHGVTDDSSLRRLWDHQLLFHFERVLKRSTEELAQVKTQWEKVFQD